MKVRVPEGRPVWGEGRKPSGGGEDGEVSVNLVPQRGSLTCGPQGQGQQLCVAQSRGEAGHWQTRILLQVLGDHRTPGGMAAELSPKANVLFLQP